MLVLSRKVNDIIHIGEDIQIRMIGVQGDTVKIGIEAPKSVDIVRGELLASLSATNTDALTVKVEHLAEFIQSELS